MSPQVIRSLLNRTSWFFTQERHKTQNQSYVMFTFKFDDFDDFFSGSYGSLTEDKMENDATLCEILDDNIDTDDIMDFEEESKNQ